MVTRRSPILVGSSIAAITALLAGGGFSQPASVDERFHTVEVFGNFTTLTMFQLFSSSFEREQNGGDAERAKDLARDHYRALFIVWMASQEIDGAPVTKMDIRGFLRGSGRISKRFPSDHLLDLDDPMMWGRVPSSVPREDVIGTIGGPELLRWVSLKTKDQQDYERYVARFRQERAAALDRADTIDAAPR